MDFAPFLVALFPTVQPARPTFGWCFTILTLLPMLLVIGLCATSALYLPGKQAIGASPYGGWVGGGSWSVSSPAAELLTSMKVRSNWLSIGHRSSIDRRLYGACLRSPHPHTLHARSADGF